MQASGTKRGNITDEYAGMIDGQNENYNVIGQKRLKKSPLMPIVIILTKIQPGEYKPLVCLLDTGTTSCIVMGQTIPHADIRCNTTTKWKTKAGTFTTDGTTTLKFMAPEFSTKPRFEYSFHVDTQSRNSTYNVILGTNFMEAFQIDIRFSTGDITYKDASIPMRDRGSLNFNLPHIIRQAEEQTFETEASTALVSRMTDIVESKYEPTDHKNLTCYNLTLQRVMRWRLVIEEFGIEIIYIKGTHNVAADALSRLPRDAPDDALNESSMIEFLETYNLTELPADAFPITYKNLLKKNKIRTAHS